jgi:DNA repair exonuclease SbcCD ATPase subunit
MPSLDSAIPSAVLAISWLQGNVYFLGKVFVLLAITAALFAWLGAKFGSRKAAAAAPADSPSVEAAAKRLESELARVRSELARAQDELQQARASANSGQTVSAEEVAALKQKLETAETEAQSLRSQAQKARSALDQANAKVAEAGKAERDRSFALQNELSKAREEIQRLRAGAGVPAASDDEMRAEILRLKQSLAAATQAMGQAQRERDTLRDQIAGATARAASPATGEGEPASAESAAASLLPRFASAPAAPVDGQPSPASGPNPELARQKVENLRRKRDTQSARE